MESSFVSYSKAHGRTPEAMLAHDEQEWPGGKMTNFILWIGENLRAYYKAKPGAFLDAHTLTDQGGFTEYLKQQSNK